MTDHRHTWCLPGNSLDIVFTIDDWQGPTDALVRCTACDGCEGCETIALLRLLHWSGPRLTKRIFAVSPLPDSAVSVFLRNMRSDYCDLHRHQAEVDALIATAEATSDVIVVDVAELRVLARHDPEVMRGRPLSWRQSAPDESDPYWLDLLARK